MGQYKGDTTGPNDYIRMSVIALVLLRAYEHQHSNIKDEYLEEAVFAHLELLKIEGVDIGNLFYDSDEDRREAVRDTLHNACVAEVMFTKIRNDGRHHFEGSFPRWASRLIKEYLPEEIHKASLAVVDHSTGLLAFGGDGDRVVSEYKRKKEQETQIQAAAQ